MKCGGGLPEFKGGKFKAPRVGKFRVCTVNVKKQRVADTVWHCRGLRVSML